jgi:toxin-antitoxin system PIN domain toxin
MTTASEMVLLDTNVLVYALDKESPHHLSSRRVVDRAAKGDQSYCISSQTLAEFLSVVTNARRVKSPRSVSEALDALETFLAMPGITLLSVTPEVTTRWLAMVRHAPVSGPHVFDVQLAATALEAGVSRVCTYNAADFQRIDGIEVIVP